MSRKYKHGGKRNGKVGRPHSGRVGWTVRTKKVTQDNINRLSAERGCDVAGEVLDRDYSKAFTP